MITAAQLRAARGLLDWTRTELAKAANISPETVKNIEHGTFRPQETTAEAIRRAFAIHDVIFTEDEGVKKSTNLVTNYEGAEGFKKYVDDLYTNLSKADSEHLVCVVGIDDKLFAEALGDYVKTHIDRMSKIQGLRFKALANESVKVFMADKYIEYRKLPSIPFALPFCVYDNYFEIIVFGKGEGYPKVVSVKSKVIADAYRAQFEALWKLSATN
jgi:DNA-binding XRE family transcriptional regulator